MKSLIDRLTSLPTPNAGAVVALESNRAYQIKPNADKHSACRRCRFRCCKMRQSVAPLPGGRALPQPLREDLTQRARVGVAHFHRHLLHRQPAVQHRARQAEPVVIQLFVYPSAYPTHGVWAAALLYLMARRSIT